MPPLCSRLNQDYQELLALKEQFSLELKEAVATGDFSALALLKAEIIEKKTVLEVMLRPSPEAAEAIMGKELFLGPEAVQETFGILPENIPSLPFNREELREAKQRGEMLVLQIDRLADGTPLTGQSIHERFGTQKDGNNVFFGADWCEYESFFTADTPRLGWKLVAPEVLPGSKGKNYYEQTELLADHVQRLFAGKTLPAPYQEALAEWEREKRSILPLMDAQDWQEAATRLTVLQLNILTRDSFIEKIYQMKLVNQTQGKNVLPDTYTWTKSRASSGSLMCVGFFATNGAFLSGYDPSVQGDDLGVSFSRSV